MIKMLNFNWFRRGTIEKWVVNIFLIISPLLIISCSEDGIPQTESYYLRRIYSIKTDGSDMKYITTGGYFEITRDSSIIYLYEHELRRCTLEGADVKSLTPPGFELYNFQLYQNDRKVFLSKYGGAPLYTVDTDGSNFKVIPFPEGIVREVAIDPDGDELVFSAFTGLYLLNDNGKQQIMDSANGLIYGELYFNSDGNKIIYTQYNWNEQGQYDLRLYNILTNENTSVFNDYTNSIDISDWNTMLFGAHSGIYLEDLGDYSQVYLRPGYDPHFSSDSTRITLMEAESIIVMNLDNLGSQVISLNMPGNQVIDHELSPAGDRVYFAVDSSWTIILKPGGEDGIVY